MSPKIRFGEGSRGPDPPRAGGSGPLERHNASGPISGQRSKFPLRACVVMLSEFTCYGTLFIIERASIQRRIYIVHGYTIAQSKDSTRLRRGTSTWWQEPALAGRALARLPCPSHVSRWVAAGWVSRQEPVKTPLCMNCLLSTSNASRTHSCAGAGRSPVSAGPSTSPTVPFPEVGDMHVQQAQ